ncbi:MAG: ROK family protein [Solobacterium sp.]|nr:ROK family protein [Solobacterium sp.]
MNFFVLDIGGSSIKYAVMDENGNILSKGKAESRHLKTKEEFVSCLADLHRTNGSCEGGIAVSYCGEVDAYSGFLHSGGSYPYMAGNNLKEMLEKECGVPASVENDGNCAGLAESRYGSLRGYANAAAIVIGTGLGAALILNNTIYRGAHFFAGSTSLLVRNIDEKYTKQQWAFRTAGAAWCGKEYGLRKGVEAVDGIAFFEAVNGGDETAKQVLKDYCSTLANLIFDMNMVLDLEAYAIGGGISQQPVLLEYLQNAFDDIYAADGMERLHLPKPEIRVCQYHNDANLLGALAHHLDLINKY